tara:strand:- start:9738 stop:10592 length:855 start_codon:yes stop_codon:yes gene_type:complete
MNKKVKIVECPRDAMQGLNQIVPTKLKAEYINSLIKVGFEYIDFGSFVSSKIVPQMSDTIDVLKLLNIDSNTSLLAVVLNKKGAEVAASFDEIKILGYPLSISEIFQKKNSNKSIKESLHVVDQIIEICYQNNKKPLIYFSMAFGNPYNEVWDKSILLNYINQIKNKGVNLISLADTIGNSDTNSIRDIFYSCAVNFTDLDIGLHLHSHPSDSFNKIQSAWQSGCRRFDVAISGYGGCPFAQDQLVGNISTQQLLNFLAKNNLEHSLDLLALENSYNKSRDIFD